MNERLLAMIHVHTGPRRQRGMARLSLTLRASILIAGLLNPTLAHAALDADAKKAYQLQIVLQIGANRVFTPLFQDQLERDVQNQLKLAFGDLAQIEVTRAHPLLRDIEAKGLDAALESWDSLSDRTTHFVLLDYVAGSYRIRTRFHDGKTGQPGALAKIKQTNDRAGVADAVAALIEASFSPVGTVTAVAANGKDVTLTLQGGELGVPLDRWVQRGHVFAVSRIVEANGKQRAERVEWALLEVVDGPAKGVCGCRYRHRYTEDTLSEGPGALGYRALKVPTGTGVVKLQLLDATTLKPLDGVRVRIQRPGDKAKPEEPLTDRNGMVVTSKAFAHFAVIEVVTGKKDARGLPITPTLPVALIEGRTVVARVSIQEDRDSLASLEVRRDAWLSRAYDNLRMSSERAHALAGQLNQSLEAARDAGRKSLKDVEAEIIYLETEADELGRLAKEKKVNYDLREGRQQIDELRKKAKELDAFVERMDGVLKNSTGDDKALGLHKLLERAKLLESECDFDSAILLYDMVVQANPAQTNTIKKHVDKLKQDWKEQGTDHAKARAFIYQTWPTLDSAGLGQKMDEAKKALATCKNAGDKLTPQKLLRANVVHTVNLKTELQALRKRRDSEDNRNQAKRLEHISRELLSLHQDATKFVGTR